MSNFICEKERKSAANFANNYDNETTLLFRGAHVFFVCVIQENCMLHAALGYTRVKRISFFLVHIKICDDHSTWTWIVDTTLSLYCDTVSITNYTFCQLSKKKESEKEKIKTKKTTIIITYLV